MRRSAALTVLVLGSLVAQSIPVSAADSGAGTDTGALADRLDLDYSLRAGYWSASRSLDGEHNIPNGSLWLRSQPQLSDSTKLKMEGWVASYRPYDRDTPRFDLREGYLTWSGENLDFKIGRQIVVWGRADRINPTDNLSSRDYTLLFPEDDDQRRGNLMVRGGYALGDDYTLSALWLPEFRPNVLPTQKGTVILPDRQGNDPKQFAVKLDRSGGSFDWSVSYFDGHDRNFDVQGVPLAGGEVALQRLYPHIRVVGADAATTVGSYGLRAETAYTMVPGVYTSRPDLRHSEWQGVLGADRTFGENLNVNLQYIVRIVQDFQSPGSFPTLQDSQVATTNDILRNQLDPVQHGASVRISDQFWNDTLKIEASNVIYEPRSQGTARVKASYAITDSVHATVGGGYYYGFDNSYFGMLKNSSGGYVEITWGY